MLYLSSVIPSFPPSKLVGKLVLVIENSDSQPAPLVAQGFLVQLPVGTWIVDCGV